MQNDVWFKRKTDGCLCLCLIPFSSVMLIVDLFIFRFKEERTFEIRFSNVFSKFANIRHLLLDVILDIYLRSHSRIPPGI